MNRLEVETDLTGADEEVSLDSSTPDLLPLGFFGNLLNLGSRLGTWKTEQDIL